MPNFSGTWTARQQMQARGASTWPAPPGAPTIGTASIASATSVSVAFTAPACTGYPSGGITGYLAKSTPGCFTATGSSSPLTVSGLSTGTAYTFKVKATNATGYGPCSAASNSVTPVAQGQQAYTTPGTYSWVAPACVTSVSVVSVGAGAPAYSGYGGGLGYKNNYAVTSGSSYTVVVGTGCTGTDSYFVNTSTVAGKGGSNGSGYVGDGGGNGGGAPGGNGGGAGGYAGNGGKGSTGIYCGGCATAGTGGAGGGGGPNNGGVPYIIGGGGGVGLLGQGASGARGTYGAPGGGGGSGGANGGQSVGPACGQKGGAYGGGGGFSSCAPYTSKGGSGAVRIIWPGSTRQFPSTNTGNV